MIVRHCRQRLHELVRIFCHQQRVQMGQHRRGRTVDASPVGVVFVFREELLDRVFRRGFAGRGQHERIGLGVCRTGRHRARPDPEGARFRADLRGHRPGWRVGDVLAGVVRVDEAQHPLDDSVATLDQKVEDIVVRRRVEEDAGIGAQHPVDDPRANRLRLGRLEIVDERRSRRPGAALGHRLGLCEQRRRGGFRVGGIDSLREDKDLVREPTPSDLAQRLRVELVVLDQRLEVRGHRCGLRVAIRGRAPTFRRRTRGSFLPRDRRRSHPHGSDTALIRFVRSGARTRDRRTAAAR